MHLSAGTDAKGICLGVATRRLATNALCGSDGSSLGWYSSGDIVFAGEWREFSREGIRGGQTAGVLVHLAQPGGPGEAAQASLSFFLDGRPVGSVSQPVAVPADAGPLYPCLTLYNMSSKVICHFAAPDIRYRSHLPPHCCSLDGVPLS
eukprot:tig00020660_g12505.t1